jgi:iron complex outermembrane receptor protein
VSISSWSQDTTVSLSEVTLIANGYQQPTRNTGRNVLVIPGAVLLRSPAYSIDEMLRFVPGMEVQLRGPQGAQGDLLIRGGTFQQVLVLIDGLRINDPLTGHFNSYLPIDPLEIERIEILKGPDAALWGSEAVGGVIQIFTKTFSDRLPNPLSIKNKTQSSLEGSIGVGQYKLGNLQSRWYHLQKQHSFSLAATSRNSAGVEQRGIRGYFYINSIQSAWQYRFSNGWKLNLRAAVDHRKFAAQNFYTTFLSDTANEKVATFWSQSQLSRSFSKSQLEFNVGYKIAEDRYQFRPTALPNLNKSGLAQLQVRYIRKTEQPLQYQTTLQIIQRSINSNDRGNHQVAQGALFAGVQYRFTKNLLGHYGLRFVWDELYGTVLIPQFNFSYARSRSQWRIAAGRSFRDADFTERYNNYNKTLVTSGRIGNPALSPEDAWQAEIGYDLAVNNKFGLHSSLFYRDHRGLVDWVTTPFQQMPRQINLLSTGTYALARNIERVQTWGVETDLRYNDSLGKGKLMTQAGLLVLNNYAPTGAAGFYLNGHARIILNALADYQLKKMGLSLGLAYKKRDSQVSTALSTSLSPSYCIVNMKFQYQLNNAKWIPFIMADNLFNSSYSDILGSPMPGRWISLGIRGRVF